MNTRMEKVAQDVALTALRIVSHVAQPTPKMETLKESFQARWPVPDSNRPMNDAISAVAQAVSSCTGQDADTWKTTVSQTWQPAVEEVVESYFKAARASFQKGDALEGAEILTDAVRVTLGHIAATRDWPHGTHDDLYSIAAALGSRTEWPNTIKELDQALESVSKEGDNLGAALGASMGRPDMLKFGVYAENPDGPEEDGILFATATIELANRLAAQAAP
jgi:hypothetical protein